MGKHYGGWDEGKRIFGELLAFTHSLLNCLSDKLCSFQIYSWIDNFVTEHSDIVSKIQIGHSFENRSILVLKVKASSVDHYTV